MEIPSAQKLDETRKKGFRPGVIGCFINDKEVLLFLKKEFNLWTLPQGGVLNKAKLTPRMAKETLVKSLEKKMSEEVGSEFFKTCSHDYELVGEDLVEFPPERHNVLDLFTDTGEKVEMIGKVYYFFVINSPQRDLQVSKTPYDDCFWMSYKPALFLANKIHQPGKRRILVNCLNLLMQGGFIK